MAVDNPPPFCPWIHQPRCIRGSDCGIIRCPLLLGKIRMIFNVGSVGVDLNDIERRLSNLLKGKFKSVKSSFYGAFHSGGQPRWDIENDGIVRRSNDTERPKSSRLRAMISLSVAYLMYMLPPLRTGFGLKKRKLYFCCKGKL